MKNSGGLTVWLLAILFAFAGCKSAEEPIAKSSDGTQKELRSFIDRTDPSNPCLVLPPRGSDGGVEEPEMFAMLSKSSTRSEIRDVVAIGADISDRCLVALSKLQLRRVNLSNTLISDSGISSAINCPTIETLTAIDCPNVTGSGYTGISNSKSLRMLDISNLRHNIAIPEISQNRSIVRLSIQRSAVNAQVDMLVQMKQLEYLGLPECDISNVAIEKIAQMPNIVALDLRCNRNITDEGLFALLRVKQKMEYIAIDGPDLSAESYPNSARLTPSAIERIKAAYPAAEILVFK